MCRLGQLQGPRCCGLSPRDLPSAVCKGRQRRLGSRIPAAVEHRGEPPGVYLTLFLSPYLTWLPGSDIYQMEKDIALEQERNARYRPPKILEPTAFQEPPPKVSQAPNSLAPVAPWITAERGPCPTPPRSDCAAPLTVVVRWAPASSQPFHPTIHQPWGSPHQSPRQMEPETAREQAPCGAAGAGSHPGNISLGRQ